MAWIEINTGTWWQQNWRLVNCSIYKDIRWLAQTSGFAIFGIPKHKTDSTAEWDVLFFHTDLKPVLCEFKRIKRQLKRKER